VTCDLGGRYGLVPEDQIAAAREPNYASDLFFDVAFVPQLGNRKTRDRGIHCLPGQSYKFARIVFVVLDQRGAKLVVDSM
jgi:hypothetical protein